MGALSRWLCAALALVPAAAACSDKFAASESCSPHEQVECVRADCDGRKTCAADGRGFGPCECPGSGGAAGSSGGSSAGASGSTAGKSGSGGASGASGAGAGGTTGGASGAGNAGGTGGTGGETGGASGAGGAAGGAAGSAGGGTGGSGGRPPCDGEAEHEFGGHCYLLGSPDTDYFGARETCVKWGGTLVAINSAEEQAFLHDTFGTAPDRWIGFSAEVPTGPYSWETGEPVTYTNWKNMGQPGSEPSDLPGELCVMMAGPAYPESWGYWNNITCSPTTAPYLCER